MGSLPSGISGSRIAAVLGENSFQTRLDVWMTIMEEREPGWCKKNGFKFEPFTGNAATRFGTAFEDDIIRLAESTHDDDYEIVDLEREYKHAEYDFITCHIDGRYNRAFLTPDLSDVLTVLHEGKTTTTFAFRDKWGEPGTDHIPREYKAQTQEQMLLTGADAVIVSVLVFPERQNVWEEAGIDATKINTVRWADALNEMGYFHQYIVKADPEVQELMAEAALDFWNNHVLTGKPPVECCYADIRKRLIEPNGTVVASDDMHRLAKEYKDITKETGNSEKRKDALKTMLCKYMIENAEHSPIDEDSTEKIILRDTKGHKLCSYDGKRFG